LISSPNIIRPRKKSVSLLFVSSLQILKGSNEVIHMGVSQRQRRRGQKRGIFQAYFGFEIVDLKGK